MTNKEPEGRSPEKSLVSTPLNWELILASDIPGWYFANIWAMWLLSIPSPLTINPGIPSKSEDVPGTVWEDTKEFLEENTESFSFRLDWILSWHNAHLQGANTHTQNLIARSQHHTKKAIAHQLNTETKRWWYLSPVEKKKRKKKK